MSLFEERTLTVLLAGDPTLEIEQELLAPQSASVSAKLTVLVYHPMAGDDDGQRIRPVGSPHGALGAASPYIEGQPFVRNCLTVRNRQELLPHRPLEGGTRCVNRDGELLQSPGEVALQLVCQSLDVLVGTRDNGTANTPPQRSDFPFQRPTIGEFDQTNGA